MDSFSLYLNREIGWLKFNQRVLALAKDPSVPLLERIKYLNIFHSNLDEFYMKRVGGLKRQQLANVASLSHDGLTSFEQILKIREQVIELSKDIDLLLKNDLFPKLKEEGIHLLMWKDLSDSEQAFAHDFFVQKIFPVLTPMAVDRGHPFPLISNLSTSLAVSLKLPSEEDLLFARIKIPQVFPTWLVLPSDNHKEHRLLSLVDLIKKRVQMLFPKMEIERSMTFRVSRNADIEADQEDAEDLLELIEEEVKQRKFSEVVRLEHGPKKDPWLLDFLKDELELHEEDIYQFPVFLEYKDLGPVANLNLPHLKVKPWSGVTLPPLSGNETNIFNAIKMSDILVHHPFESFTTSVERFILSAADDPDVIAIKMTLYRTSQESSIAQALIRAAEKGKQVVCLIELKARFDEERNIYWAQTMENAGVHVVYGIVGLKTHAKLALIVRREGEEFRSYAHIGTGNYNPQTAKVYTDLGLFTCQPDIVGEVVEVFHYLTGRSLKTDYQNILVAPIHLKKAFLQLIENEIENSKKGLSSGIIAKCNSLEDRDIIDAFYRASQSGVEIELIIRGFSCLRPGVPTLSENIRVTSVLGQFLEHSRVFYFRNGELDPLEGRFFIGSADLMSRNLLGRVEVLCPIRDGFLRKKLWTLLSAMKADSRHAWRMDSNGNYSLSTTDPGSKGGQDMLMDLSTIQALESAEIP